jgi:hypothetical protein
MVHTLILVAHVVVARRVNRVGASATGQGRRCRRGFWQRRFFDHVWIAGFSVLPESDYGSVLATTFFRDQSDTLAYFSTQTSAPKSVVERVQLEQDRLKRLSKPVSSPADVPQLPQK